MEIKYHRRIKSQLKKAPLEVLLALDAWQQQITLMGYKATVADRFQWNDHPLKGDRKGQRSVYLWKQWRAIYTINNDVVMQPYWR